MELKGYIRKIIEEKLKGTEYFIIDIQVSSKDLIRIFIDGDNGVSIDFCTEISRYAKQRLFKDLNRLDDYSLEVSSPGPNLSMVLPRQYGKNIGRKVQIGFANGEVRNGILRHADGHHILIDEEDVSDINNRNKSKAKKFIQVEILFSNIQFIKVIPSL